MSNPTQAVPTESTRFDDDKVYWPLDPTNTSDTIYNGEMLGMKYSSGYAFHFDDTAPMLFLGTKEGITHRLQTDTPATDFKELIRRPKYFAMNLASGNAAIPTAIGSPAYAADSGHVQLTTGGLTNNNLAGMVVDIGRSGSTAGTSGGILSLTGATAVVIAPPQWGALLGLVAQGVVGGDATAAATAGGNAASMLITGGRGGNTTGTGASAGGNGSTLTLTAGNGGNAAAGTGNGGAGGNLNLVPGTGGTSAGGTAGAAGEVQFNGSSDGIEMAAWLQGQGSAPSAGSFSIFLATRAYRIKSFKAVFSTASSSGTATATKDTGTAVPGAGTAILTGTVSLAGTANTVVSGTLVATAATLQLAAGDRLALTLGGTLTSLAGCVVQIGLTPI
jgi:hypothetical protein